MRIPPRITTLGGSVALLSLLLASGPLTAQAATPATAPPARSASSVSAPASSPAALSPAALSAAAVGTVCYSALPAQAHDTLDLIAAGGPYPYEQDGTVFQNREGILPSQGSGYYHEYTVVTPGSPTRGARRVVTGEQSQEDYYTADHYESFDLVDRDC
ncbi:Guanyl-specific ribonuclease Sa3 precursor [Streptomyces sp. ADI96-02]|uniref:ribonuclease domain-containing protein n=1 Tax=Streptomyces sp. ADI96-02 TaxID=1522760 RepID=UPI000F557FCC|nr:ribonuclease domain-containing protein [Streptomyces sp. ADI96-02]RPK56319.1 Guanyl-specific ribonuclease Sa3 precursor [Streptomyces sp. ADI96-02]